MRWLWIAGLRIAVVAAAWGLAGCGMGSRPPSVEAGAVGPSSVTVAAGTSSESERKVTVLRDVIYAHAQSEDAMRADIWLPQREGDQLAPAVLMLHGGGWKLGDLRWSMKRNAQNLAARGVVVMNITYRQLPRWCYPAPLEDARLALDFLRAHSLEYGVDRERIGLWGYSAGGHLATLLAGFEGNGPRGVRALVAGGAPQDLRAFPDHRLVKAFVGGPVDKVPERWAHASPLTHLGPQMPPTFFYHGAKDSIVTPVNVTAAKELLDRSGVETEVMWLPGRGHVGASLLNASQRQRVIDFLLRHLGPQE